MQIPSSSFGVSGHVTVTKYDAHGNVNFRSEFTNLVLDNFFKTSTELLGNNTNFLTRHNTIFIGADVQTPPQVTDTALANQVAFKIVGSLAGNAFNSFVLGETIEEDHLVFRRVVQFDESEAIGNLTEVGLGYSNGIGTQALSFRALIKTTDGNPVVVTKSDNERLIVGYEFRIYRPPLYSVSETFAIGSENFRFVSTMLFSATYLDNQVPVDQWDFESLRGRITYSVGDGFAGLAGSNSTFSHETQHGILVSHLSGSRELLVVPHTSDREVHPMVVIRHANNPEAGKAMNIQTSPSANIDDYGGTFCKRWVTSNGHNSPIIGVLVDATTLAPKPFTLPANHRLKFTVNPANAQLITRRV